MATTVVKSVSYRTGEWSDNIKSITYDSVSVADLSDLETLESRLKTDFEHKLIPFQETINLLKKMLEDSFAENQKLRAFLEEGYEKRLKAEEDALYDAYKDIAEKISKKLK